MTAELRSLVCATLVDEEKRIRALMKQIIALRLDGPSGDSALANLKSSYEAEQPELFEGAMLEFNKIWHAVCVRVSRQGTAADASTASVAETFTKL